MNIGTKRRLLIIASHPVQYQSPWFRDLAACEEFDLVVGFLDLPDSDRQGIGFGVDFSWDIPLTEGFPWRRLDSRISRRNRGFGFFGRWLLRPRAQLKQLQPDAVLIMGWHQLGLMQAWVAARTLGVTVVVRGESNAKRQRPRWIQFVHRWMLRQGQGFVAIGQSNAEFYSMNGVEPSRIFMAPYFVDNKFFASRCAELDRTAVRARFGIAAEAVCLLFAGKFEPKKRPGDLIAAVRALPLAIRSRVHVLMVGSGALEESLRAQSEDLLVTWAGFLNQTEIPAAYGAADALVLPSDTGETWGLVVNEAMACGKPAIVSDQVGCAGDLVIHEETGLVYPMGNVDSLSSMIERMVVETALRHRMGAAARYRVMTLYTADRSTSALMAAVEHVSNRNAQPRIPS